MSVAERENARQNVRTVLWEVFLKRQKKPNFPRRSPMPPSPGIAEAGEETLIFALLYGPLVQFARQQADAEPTVVAMPTALAVSVDVVHVHPEDATPPENLASFCFCPVMKLREATEMGRWRWAVRHEACEMRRQRWDDGWSGVDALSSLVAGA